MTISIPPAFIRRVLISVLLSLIPVMIVQAVFVWVNRQDIPTQVELAIPNGTAELVAAGEPVPTIPDGLVCARGDLLVLTNHDKAIHPLGPAYIPPHSTVSIPVDSADHFTNFCTFKPSNYLGVDIVQPFTVWIFLLGLLTTFPPTLGLIFLYSFAIPEAYL